jgi:electron transfer flavoprotein beta subunit
MKVGVALKWAPRRLQVDPLDGGVEADPHLWGMSAADAAALETALALAERWEGMVVAACVGPAGADAMLREALAAGAWRAVRAESAAGALPGSPASLQATVAGLGHALSECPVVLFGDASLDGGSAAVPALYAASASSAQALGLVSVTPQEEPGILLAERRLDAGRRERLRVRAPAVLSVEAGAARLRRASLAGELAAQSAEIVLLALPAGAAAEPVTVRPYRPRARALPGPDQAQPPRERVSALLGLAAPVRERREIRADPAQAAAEILAQLRAWGYA